MNHSSLEKLAAEAIRKRHIVEVEYIREEDGTKTKRLMEPFDVAPGRRTKDGEPKFWGWCLFHNFYPHHGTAF